MGRRHDRKCAAIPGKVLSKQELSPAQLVMEAQFHLTSLQQDRDYAEQSIVEGLEGREKRDQGENICVTFIIAYCYTFLFYSR